MDMCLFAYILHIVFSAGGWIVKLSKRSSVDEKLWEKRLVPSPGDDFRNQYQLSCDNQPPSIDDGKYCIVHIYIQKTVKQISTYTS